MTATLRFHEQAQREYEVLESMFHRRVYYPQYGKGGLYVTIFTESLASGTIWEKYIKELEAFLERNKEGLSDITTMTIIGKSKYVA